MVVGDWRRWARRVGVLAATVPMLLLASAGGAAAAQKGLGSTPPAMSWIRLVDSRGISVWNYEMSLDRGGVTSPGKVIWSFLIDLGWQFYRCVVIFAIWLLDWVLNFAWLPAVATPATTLSGGLHGIVARFGLTPTLLTIAATVSVLWMARGKWALGIFELFVSLLIASLAVGMLADPVGAVVGDSGLIMQSRNLGLEVADGLAGNGSGGNADQLGGRTSGMLVDTFIRVPAELLNFGTVLDGGRCQAAYDGALNGGPYGTKPAIRQAVGGCDSSLGDFAASPGSGQAISAGILSPAALLVLLFAVVLAGAVFLAALYALFHALKTIVTLVPGLLPGSARGALWVSIGELAMSLVTLVFCIVFLGGYLQLLTSVFTARTSGNSIMATFVFVDILLLAGIVLFWRGRKQLRRAAERLAKVLATRPGGGPSALPERHRFDPAATYYKARLAARTGRIAGGALAAGRDTIWDATGASWATEQLHNRAEAGGQRVRAGSQVLRAGLTAAAKGLPAAAGPPLLLAGMNAAAAATTALSAGASRKAFGAKAAPATAALHNPKSRRVGTAAARRATLLGTLTSPPAPAGPGRHPPAGRINPARVPPGRASTLGSTSRGGTQRTDAGSRTPPLTPRLPRSGPPATPAASLTAALAGGRPRVREGKVTVVTAADAAAAAAAESLRAALDARRRWAGGPPGG